MDFSRWTYRLNSWLRAEFHRVNFSSQLLWQKWNDFSATFCHVELKNV